MLKVVIVGAGGHGTVVADVLCSMRDAGQPVTPLGFVDDGMSARVSRVLSLPVFAGGLAALTQLDFDAAIVAIGDNETRRRITDRLRRNGVRLTVARHPDSTVARETVIEPGAMICAGAVIGPSSRVGAGTIVNTQASVDHHNQIGSFVHIAPGAHLGGMVRVRDLSLIGIGAIVLPGRRIGCGAVVGAGAVVVRHVPNHVTVVGIPARMSGDAPPARRHDLVTAGVARPRRDALLTKGPS